MKLVLGQQNRVGEAERGISRLQVCSEQMSQQSYTDKGSQQSKEGRNGTADYTDGHERPKEADCTDCTVLSSG